MLPILFDHLQLNIVQAKLAHLQVIRDIRKLVKLGLLALSFGKTRVEKNGGTSKYRTQGQTLECTKTQVETVWP
jgi:hypothetical protein